MSLTKREIQHGFGALKKMARKSYQKGAFTDAMHYLRVCSSIAGQFNLQYADDDMEILMKQIAERIIIRVKDFEPNTAHWVLYDDFCTTYVLGLQWLEAMVLSGRKILYITTRNISAESRHKNILEKVAEYENVTTVIIPQGDEFKRAQALYDTIVQFKPSKLVMHKSANLSVINLVLPVLPESVTSYVINLSDQTFWLGVRDIDYCLEFRQFGASVSLQRRGLRPEQLLLVPFYPADDRNVFAGFPVECTADKVVVFSGGDYYKTLDEKRVFWKLIQRLLKTFPQLVFLFATKNNPEGNSEIHHFIKENHFEGRFIYIGFRPDIYQVFAHCDIYMGTSPTSGSLMSQLAAINAKPILQYYEPGTPDDETEQALCINEDFNISFQDEDAFLHEAEMLITDKMYRQKQGERLKHAMMQHNQFNGLVLKTLETDVTHMAIREYAIDYEELDNRWYYLEKAGYVNALPYIYSTLGAGNCLKYAPALFVKKNWRRLVKKAKKLR